jgi:hypothetical protein
VTLGKEVNFVECLPASTRQRICQRVPLSACLSSAVRQALGKECLFAECQGHHTRQRNYIGAQVLVLCRVLWLWHSAKHLFAECNTRQSDQYTPFYLFCIPSKQTKDITYTSQISSQISHIHHISHKDHKSNIRHSRT